MLSLYDRPTRLCDGISRREALRIGGLGLGGLTLASLAAARQAQAAAEPTAASFGRAKACILLFLLGGPPQHETWDPKPDAPVEVRGGLKPIASRTPGLMVGELMPRTAQLTDKICVLRALSTRDNAHSSSGYWMLTGTPHVPMNTDNSKPGAPNDWPCVGAVVQKLRPASGALPGAVRLPEEIWNTGHVVWPGQDAGFLGRDADPWLLNCEPQKPGFKVDGLALPQGMSSLTVDRRRALLEQVNEHFKRHETSGAAKRWNSLDQQAFDLLSSGHGNEAFQLERETDATRDRYGRNRWGQSVLLARRLIEAGVSLVQVNWTRWETDTQGSPAWDTHAKNQERLEKALMPPMDLAYSALLEDLSQRGLLDQTLVVQMGEFGRSPKINPAGGRDHWGHVFSVSLAGGGVRGGQVIGGSDKIGAYPASGRHEPQDLTATIYHALGIPPETMIHDRLSRPLAISKGAVLDVF
jgi:hypothetical protein